MSNLWPIAWLLTWPTYGTWLHGDERGSWDRKAEPPFRKFIEPNIRFEALRRSQLKHAPVTITPAMRRVVREAIEQECKFRGWRLYAQNVRTNHVHVVVINHQDGPVRVLQALKARATRVLRERKLLEPDQPAWVHGGGKTWLMDEGELTNAINYVLHKQGAALPEE